MKRKHDMNDCDCVICKITDTLGPKAAFFYRGLVLSIAARDPDIIGAVSLVAATALAHRYGEDDPAHDFETFLRALAALAGVVVQRTHDES